MKLRKSPRQEVQMSLVPPWLIEFPMFTIAHENEQREPEESALVQPDSRFEQVKPVTRS
jgi:hypothetical protein